ncbi:transposase [Streptomyces sp. Lzd4kr]|nr:transposase [Streptomyces sp. Lzd4kr]
MAGHDGRVRQSGRSGGDWREHAACVHLAVDPNVFFQRDSERTDSRRTKAAKRVCACCPVVEACLQVALQVPEPSGVWGGKTPAERRRIARPKEVPEVGTRIGELTGTPSDADTSTPPPTPSDTTGPSFTLLTDAQWARVEPLLSDGNPPRGRRRRSHRQVLEGMAYKFHTGISWRALPAAYGSWTGVFKRHRRWVLDGTWEQIREVLLNHAASGDELGWLHRRPEG